MRKRNFEMLRWPSELQAKQCWPVGLPWQMGRHWLAGISKVHREYSNFIAFSIRLHNFGSLEIEIWKVAFFEVKYMN